MTTAEYRAHVSATMSEEVFTAQVLAEAKAACWWTLHIRPARTAESWRTPVQGDGKGFPDILAIRGDRLIIAELKSGTPEKAERKLSTEQQLWRLAWQVYFGGDPRSLGHHNRGEYYLWVPADLAEIIEVLR